MTKDMDKKKFDYSEAMASLEKIAAKVEDPSTKFEEIGPLVRKSAELIAACRAYLRGVRDEINSAAEAGSVSESDE